MLLCAFIYSYGGPSAWDELRERDSAVRGRKKLCGDEGLGKKLELFEQLIQDGEAGLHALVTDRQSEHVGLDFKTK